ncbi:tRNA pseudouridine(65) synthase TruC [Aliidiomarina shirensis]|uniref:tRNA pseudouridine synthase C n=1 Tax=Aliidiomarina shirensis TaxID=1048642 RepID=A0A432WWP1_9GAMM|nr:tRNA pseudouridine(65) synthase TruC [Aliidiomarina shirensis]RUO38198.1 tRNA pseudouridine(65) synthase TruC [Aliidiomarina shirensis]
MADTEKKNTNAEENRIWTGPAFSEEKPELPIIYQDDDIVVIDKPAGLLVHRTALARGEKWFAMQLLRDKIGKHVFPVHRLDRPTSGVLVFALSARVATQIGELFASHRVQKTYHAVVRGYVAEYGRVDYPLKEELDAIADKMANKDKDAQSAVTDFLCLEQVELPFKVSKKHETSRYSLVKLAPKTGRKHQLRRHMAHIRHPIVGDTNHGDGRHNKFFREHFGIKRLLLAATNLSFPHPVTQQPMYFEASVPSEFYLPFNENAGDN